MCAHLGRDYPVNQHLRLYSNWFTWPHFFAEEYVFHVASWFGSLDPLPDAPLLVTMAFNSSIDDRTFEYRGLVPYAPSVIELGFIAQLDAEGLHTQMFPQLWVAGTPQWLLSPSIYPDWPTAAVYTDYGLRPDPAPGAVLNVATTDFSYSAKLW